MAYNFGTVMCFQTLVHVMLFSTRNMFCTLTFAHVYSEQYRCFCGCMMSRIAGMLLTYCLSDYDMVSFASTISGITFVFAIHML